MQRNFSEWLNLSFQVNPQGNQFIQRMVDEIVKELNEYEAEQAYSSDDDDLGDDDLDDLLGGLGISRS